MAEPDPDVIAAALQSPQSSPENSSGTVHGLRPITPKPSNLPALAPTHGHETESEWYVPSQESHIAQFRYYELPALTALDLSLGGRRYQVHVYFKNSGTGYVYFFPTREQARLIVDELRRSNHPYGEVLYPKVIQAKIPFNKIVEK